MPLHRMLLRRRSSTGWRSGKGLAFRVQAVTSKSYLEKKSNHQNDAPIKEAKSKLAVLDSLGILKELTQFEKLL